MWLKLSNEVIFRPIAEDYVTWQSQCAETRCVEWKSHVTIREGAATQLAVALYAMRHNS